MTSSKKPARPSFRRPVSGSVSLPRTWSHIPSHARFGPARLSLKNSHVPSGFVLSSRKPWVMKTGVVAPFASLIRLRCFQ
jgi:hypothetical protein